MVKTEDKSEFIGQILDVFEDFLMEKGISFPETPELMREAGYSEEEIEQNASENEVVLFGDNYSGLYDKLEQIFTSWVVIADEPAPERKRSVKARLILAVTEQVSEWDYERHHKTVVAEVSETDSVDINTLKRSDIIGGERIKTEEKTEE